MIVVDQSNVWLMQGVYRQYCHLVCYIVWYIDIYRCFRERKERKKEDRKERKKNEGRNREKNERM